MLVETRSPRESLILMLPDGRAIRVVYFGRGANGEAKLGVEAPRDILILRAELVEGGSVPRERKTT